MPIIKRISYKLNIFNGNIVDFKSQFKIVRPFRLYILGTSVVTGLSLKIGSKEAPPMTLLPNNFFPNEFDFFDPNDYYIIENPYLTTEYVEFYLDTITATNYNF